MSNQPFGRRDSNNVVAAARSRMKETAAPVAATPKPAKRRTWRDYLFWGFIGAMGLSVAGNLMRAAGLESPPPAVVAQAPAPSSAVEVKSDGNLISAPYKISRPSEPQATYLVHTVVKEAGSIVNAINSRESEQSGIWFTHRRYDCAKGKLFTLGDGETMEGINRKRPDTRWSGLVEGSSATQVGRYACSVAGMTLRNMQ